MPRLHRHLAGSLAVVLLLGQFAPGADPKASDKIDIGLDVPTQTYPVFVRMTDQLIAGAGEHEKFCRDHAGAKRRELRVEVTKTLHEKADRSWGQVAQPVGELEKSGKLLDVERLWIVNGFFARASGEACQKLAGLDAVSFVYLERGPLHQQKRAAKPAGGGVAPQLQALFRKVATEWKDDSDEPFTTKGLDISWNLKAIQADDAWRDEKVTGQGVVVALVDTGLMVAPALTKALWKNPGETFNGKDDDGNGYIDDLFGYDFKNDNYYCLGDDADHPHGSMCGGIIAGRPVNKRNLITAVAPRAHLMVLRGFGYLKAYEYALAQGADVMSMSYMWENMEIGNYRGVYRTAHEHLSAAGVIAVGGAGNYSNLPTGHQIALPKDIPCVIASAGLTREGLKAPASSEGPCTWDGVKFYDDYPAAKPLIKPDVTAVFTGFAVWTRPDDKGGKWTIYSREGDNMALVIGPGGNSFSGPHAAGVAALMLSANPDLPAWEVKSRLEQSCKDIGTKGRDTTFGAGLLQASKAVKAASAEKGVRNH